MLPFTVVVPVVSMSNAPIAVPAPIAPKLTAPLPAVIVRSCAPSTAPPVNATAPFAALVFKVIAPVAKSTSVAPSRAILPATMLPFTVVVPVVSMSNAPIAVPAPIALRFTAPLPAVIVRSCAPSIAPAVAKVTTPFAALVFKVTAPVAKSTFDAPSKAMLPAATASLNVKAPVVSTSNAPIAVF